MTGAGQAGAPSNAADPQGSCERPQAYRPVGAFLCPPAAAAGRGAFTNASEAVSRARAALADPAYAQEKELAAAVRAREKAEAQAREDLDQVLGQRRGLARLGRRHSKRVVSLSMRGV